MKKTIITLLAMAGVASAAQSPNDLAADIQNALTLQAYEVGDSFDISFTLESVGWSGANKAGLFSFGGEFGQNSYLRVETRAVGLSEAWIGVEINGPQWNIGNTVWNETTKTNTLTFDEPTPTWLSFAQSDKSTDDLTKQATNLVGASITFSYDGITNISSVSVRNTAGITSVLNYKDTEWDATKLAATAWTSSTWGDTVTVNVTKAVPEPTTATLSLLALAGLAARRRRK